MDYARALLALAIGRQEAQPSLLLLFFSLSRLLHLLTVTFPLLCSLSSGVGPQTTMLLSCAFGSRQFKRQLTLVACAGFVRGCVLRPWEQDGGKQGPVGAHPGQESTWR